MTVVISDTRTIIDTADSTTGWSSPVATEALNLFTSDPNPVEPTGCIGIAVSIETSEVLHTFTAIDYSNTLVYVWVLANGTMDTTANLGVAMILGDGTNTIAYPVAGSDGAVFRHSDGPVGWQCMVLDTNALPTGTAARGTVGSLDLTNATEIGAQFKTLSKALGGASNCFIDQIMVGTGGIIIAGGATGARGTFSEMATDDRSETSGKAWGVVRELGAGLFGVQGGLTFGEATANAAHWFQDTDVTVVFEDRSLGTTRYFLDIAANTTDVGHFQLGLISGSDQGQNGCNIIVPPGVGCSMDLSDPDMDTVNLYGCNITGVDGGILFSDDATNGVNHDVFGNTFTLCGQINPGRVDFKNNSIVSSSATSALLLEDSDNTLITGLDFVSDGTGHAIELTHTGAGPHSITFTGHSYSGYAATDGSTGNEVVLYNPGTTSANITITVAGSGDTPTIMKAGGVTGTVTVVNNKTITFTNLRDNSEIWVFPAGTTGEGNEIAMIENATAGSPDARTFAWTAAGGASVDYIIHNFNASGPDYQTIRVEGFTVPNVDTSIAIQQVIDRNSVD